MDKSLADEEPFCSNTLECPQGQFCVLGACKLCPTSRSLCYVMGLPISGAEACDNECDIVCSESEPCPEDMFCNGNEPGGGNCEYCPSDLEQCDDMCLPEEVVDNCNATCVTGVECTMGMDFKCPPGLFCHQDNPVKGVCNECPPAKFCDVIGLSDINLAHCQKSCKSPCNDSPLPAAPFDDPCEDNIEFCDNRRVQSHCPRTCGECEKYRCRDSRVAFSFDEDDVYYTCDVLAQLPNSLKEAICYFEPFVANTCRGTCGNCEE